MKTVAIIGAGASGMIAALNVSGNYNVILLDGNDKCGKKILLTGNGRCNYWNEDINCHMYETDDKAALDNILSTSNEVLNYLDTLGIYPKIKNGYYYPYSNQATSVRELFQRQIEEKGIDFKSNFKVSDISKKDGEFLIKSVDGKTVSANKVILAAGSKAYSKTGSDGSGYEIAKSLGHTVNAVSPALTGLISTGKFLKEWEKIRCDACVDLFVDKKKVKSDMGEIQLTSTGISGICTFNVSGVASKSLMEGKKVSAEINFMPHLKEGFYNWISTRTSTMGNATLEKALESVFNYKLMFVLFKKAGISKDDVWHRLSKDKKQSLADTVEKFHLDITDVDGFDKSQVCTGGVPLAEVDSNSMESKITNDLYITGELLDVDGRCGGYNLAFAFISGYIAGKNI